MRTWWPDGSTPRTSWAGRCRWMSKRPGLRSARLGAAMDGADAASVARGVLRYSVAQMAHALRLVTSRRGYDPRDFTFVAYGGAGPLHAVLLARELGISRTVIPPAPGHFSAFGMLLGGLRADAVRTHLGALHAATLAAAVRRAAGRRRPRRSKTRRAPPRSSGSWSCATPVRSTRWRSRCPTGPLDDDALLRPPR